MLRIEAIKIVNERIAAGDKGVGDGTMGLSLAWSLTKYSLRSYQTKLLTLTKT